MRFMRRFFLWEMGLALRLYFHTFRHLPDYLPANRSIAPALILSTGIVIRLFRFR